MKTKIYYLLIFVFAFFLTKAQEQKAIEGQFIVILKESASAPVIKNQKPNNNRDAKEKGNKAARDKALAKNKAVREKGKINEKSVLFEYADVLSGFAAKLTPAEKKALESDTDVAGVYQDFEMSLGPLKSEAAPSDVDIKSQYNSGCFVNSVGGSNDGSGKSTWIWVLDTGIDLDHPDLNVGTSATYAKSFITGETAEDGHGHGTHVAGIAAAKNNSIGMIGVSAGARVVPVKVLANSGKGSWSALLAGLNHVAKYDIKGDVINMSLGAYPVSSCENSNPTLRDAIRNLGASGTWVVMAAGNDSGNANANLPGCINGSKVLTVGALGCNSDCASYSNFGSAVDWTAVGTGVYSTYRNGGYATLSGTSMASPVVAGIVHSRNSLPLSAGTVSCKNASYKKAKLK